MTLEEMLLAVAEAEQTAKEARYDRDRADEQLRLAQLLLIQREGIVLPIPLHPQDGLVPPGWDQDEWNRFGRAEQANRGLEYERGRLTGLRGTLALALYQSLAPSQWHSSRDEMVAGDETLRKIAVWCRRAANIWYEDVGKP